MRLQRITVRQHLCKTTTITETIPHTNTDAKHQLKKSRILQIHISRCPYFHAMHIYTRFRSTSFHRPCPCSHTASSCTSRLAAVSSGSSLRARGTSTIVRLPDREVNTRPTERGENETESAENGIGLGPCEGDLGDIGMVRHVGVVGPGRVPPIARGNGLELLVVVNPPDDDDSTITTPAFSPYNLTRSSSLLLGCMRSKRSLKLSSRSRWNSVSSAQTSSRTLTDRKRSRTAVSRCMEFRGVVSCRGLWFG